MNNRNRMIIVISLAMVSVLSLAALFFFPYKVFFAILLVVSALGLFVCYTFKDNNKFSYNAESKKYSDIFIADELESFFEKNKPYLNPNYKISDLEKQLKVSRSAISLFTKRRFGRSFNQFLNLWRIAEFKRLKSLPENRNVDIHILYLKAGFKNTQQYYQAEKERIAINRKNKNIKNIKNKNKPVVEKTVNGTVKDLDGKKKPEINMRV